MERRWHEPKASMVGGVRAGTYRREEELFDQIIGCTVWGKDVGKMTGLWGAWNATLSSKSLFCSRGEPLEASAERRNTARVGTLTFFSLWHLPNVLFKWPTSTLKGHHWIHICMIIYLSRRS